MEGLRAMDEREMRRVRKKLERRGRNWSEEWR
jgi:hypothetical protein